MARTRPGNGGAPEGPRTRPKTTGNELDLTDEELRALTDEGLDPAELERVTWDRPDQEEASEHDRDTIRDDIEAMVIEREEGEP